LYVKKSPIISQRALSANREQSFKTTSMASLDLERAKMRRIMDATGIAMCAYEAETGRCDYLSESIVTMTGYAKEELQNLRDWSRIIHPDDFRLFLEMGDASSAVKEEEVECRIIRASGEQRRVRVRVAFQPDASGRVFIHSVFQDVTDDKPAKPEQPAAGPAIRSGEDLAAFAAEGMNLRLAELSPDAILLHNDLRIEYANPAAQALFGSQGELTAQQVMRMIHPDDRERAIERLTKVYRESYTSSLVEERIVRMDGTFVDVEVITGPVPYKGGVAGVSVLRDITERKRAECLRLESERLVRESGELFNRLQTSLDCFSSALFGMVKISEMEDRLIAVVREVLRTEEVCLLEVRSGRGSILRAGSQIPGWLPTSPRDWSRELPLCRIVDMPKGHLIRIGEIRRSAYVLCVAESPDQLQLEQVRIWLETICRYVSVLYDNFLVIEDLTREVECVSQTAAVPSGLLRLLFKLNEHERKRLAQDLHDAALQEQIIWYRKLDQLREDPSLSAGMRDELTRIAEGLLDVIYQIRITCIDLRPPMLKEEGLASSLESLFEFTQMRSDYSIDFQIGRFDVPLCEDQMLGLYRVVQELLANATKHSRATSLKISLAAVGDSIQLLYEDNGVGMDIQKAQSAFASMGVYGMKERVHSMNGQIVFCSAPNDGLSICIRIPAAS